MTGNIHKLSDGTKLQNYFFSFLYGTKLQEKTAPRSQIDRSQLYIPRDACATFAVCKSWKKLDSVQNAKFLVWKEVFLRLFSSADPMQISCDKSQVGYFKKECVRRFKALAENIVTKEPTTFKPEIGSTYTNNPDTTGRCTLWNRWFFTCPDQGMIHGRTIRSVFYDLSFAVPGDHPYANISNFQVGHGKIVARGLELVRKKEQKEGEEEPKKEPLPEKLCFHVWDIASKNYSYWEIPGEKGCKNFQIVDPSTLLVVKNNDKVLRCDLSTGTIKTTLKRDLGAIRLVAAHNGLLYASLLEVVRVFDENTGVYLHSIEPKDKGWINHISFINDKVVLGFHSGPPATAQYDANAKKWIVSPMFDSPELDKIHPFTHFNSDMPNATYARFGDLLWQTSYQREQRIYNVATEKHVRTLNHMGNVGGHLFENGFGLVWSMSGFQAVGTHSYNLTHLYFDSTPAPEPEKKQEVQAPEVKERAVSSNPPAVAGPAVQPVEVPAARPLVERDPPAAAPAVPPTPVSLWTEWMSYICDGIERFYNWFVSLFRS